jgi:RNA polymerase sigma-70 factor (ECF subfamily)
MEERLLLRRHLAGDEQAFGRLVDRTGGRVMGYLRRCGVPREDADDLFQEIYSRVHRSAASHQPDRPLLPWVFAIAVNVTRTWHRRRKVRAIVHGGELDPPGSREPDGLSLVEARETAGWLDGQIARLPTEQREVLHLCCVERLDQSEVARLLELPVPTVKTRLRRARLALLEARRRRGLTVQRETSP